MIYQSNIPQSAMIHAAFSDARELPNANPMGHAVLCDPRFNEKVGYMSHDEAAILREIANCMRGMWCDIGSHTGWTAAHLLSGGATEVDMIDPEYGHPYFNKTMDPAAFRRATETNLRECGFDAARHLLVQCKSAEWMAMPDDFTYVGVCIDGEREPPFPLIDAMMARVRLKPQGGVIVFHDYLGGPVRQATDYLVHEHDFRRKVYRTPQLLAVCWNHPTFEPPDHTPDPAFDWDRWLNQIGAQA